MSDKKVQKEVINVPTPGNFGYEISLDDLNHKTVKLHFFKGRALADQENFERNRLLMFRVKVVFVGDLAKYTPIDASAARETIETVDIDLDLLEVFFNQKEKPRVVKKIFAPLVDKYLGVPVGALTGTLTINYKTFTEFVNFLQYLSYEPFVNENPL